MLKDPLKQDFLEPVQGPSALTEGGWAGKVPALRDLNAQVAELVDALVSGTSG